MEIAAVLEWFTQNLLGAAGIVYAAAIAGVSLYTCVEQKRGG